MGLAALTNVDLALNRFLAEHISISTSARSRASTSQTYLREMLRGKADIDSEFPRLLHSADSDFIGGSFGRHTKIWPLDDIDLFLPLEGGGLIYMNDSGWRLPFGIATDGESSRLNHSGWMTNHFVDSYKVLEGFREAVSSKYPLSKVSVDKHCVNLGTTIGATADSDGIGFDIVPALLLHSEAGSTSFYLVPNGTGGWMRTNPRADNELCAELHAYHQKTYRKAVRLVKYWNRQNFNSLIQSYYIELAISVQFANLRRAGSVVSSTTQALAIALLALSTAVMNGPLQSLVPEAPDVPAPILEDGQIAALIDAVETANFVVNQAYIKSDQASALVSLDQLFDTSFFA